MFSGPPESVLLQLRRELYDATMRGMPTQEALRIYHEELMRRAPSQWNPTYEYPMGLYTDCARQEPQKLNPINPQPDRRRIRRILLTQ